VRILVQAHLEFDLNFSGGEESLFLLISNLNRAGFRPIVAPPTPPRGGVANLGKPHPISQEMS
jgi:hypothetical protein